MIPETLTAEELQAIPADAPLADELAGDEVVEMANLTSTQTGVLGAIFIATAMGWHRLRVKYFVQPGRTQPSFSVSLSDSPTFVANSLPGRIVRQMAPQIVEWVRRNGTDLLDFWDNGDTWTQPEVNDFIRRLHRL